MLHGAERWLVDLPDLVSELEASWGFAVGRSYQDGTEAFTCEATLDAGRPAVLKVPVPRPGDAAANEATVLELAAGDGCPLLFRFDPTRGALLMERLGRSLFELGLPLLERHRIMGDVAATVWRLAPDCGLPTGAEKAVWLTDHVAERWEELDRPCSARAVDHALACAERRRSAHDDERARLVHGDVHQWNVLEAGRGYKLIDPDGLLAEPEYDLGIVMREDPVELMAGDPQARAHRLAARFGLDAEAVWEWGVVERVSTGLLATGIDLQPVGRQMLEAADRIAADHPA